MEKFIQTVHSQIIEIRNHRKELYDLRDMYHQTYLKWLKTMSFETTNVENHEDIALEFEDIKRKTNDMNQQLESDKQKLLNCFTEYVIENGFLIE